jgi:hypothetical protein
MIQRAALQSHRELARCERGRRRENDTLSFLHRLICGSNRFFFGARRFSRHGAEPRPRTRKNPRIAALLLGNDDPRSQGSAGFLVESFLSVLAELEGSADDQERAARELLRKRGLTAPTALPALTAELRRDPAEPSAPSLKISTRIACFAPRFSAGAALLGLF